MSKKQDRIIRGARRIALHVFGEEDQWRAVYALADELGLFMLGGMLAGRSSTLDARLKQKESQGRKRAVV